MHRTKFVLRSVGSRVGREKKFLIENLLVRIHFIVVVARWTGLAPWDFEFPFPGSLTSTFPHTRPLSLARTEREK